MRRGLLTAALATAALGAFGAPAGAQLSLVQYPPGTTFSQPYYVTSPPGDPSRVFVVEGGGTIQLVKNGVKQASPFLDISGDPDFIGGGERGLLSAAFAPDYASSGLLYIQYTRDSPVMGEQHYLITEEVRRSTANPDLADEASRRVVLTIPHLVFGNHNGGQLQFGPDGYLYISTGDGGGPGDPGGNAQDRTSLLGKLLRIDPSGDSPGQYTSPSGNPFAAAGNPGADEIWSYGLRNPWRFSLDRLRGDLTIGDVGQATKEEVDFVSSAAGRGRGVNFGWNCREGSVPYPNAPLSCAGSSELFEDPALDYDNPPGSDQAAVAGGYVVRDGALPSLLGHYVFADTFDVPFANELQSAVLSDAGATGPAGLGLTADFVVSFGEDACAHLYVASALGIVYRLEPESGPFPCAPQQPAAPGLVVKVQHVNAKPKRAASRARARWKRSKHRRPRARRGRARR